MSEEMYKLTLARQAARYYNRVDTSTVQRLNRCFMALQQDPVSGGDIKPLKGEEDTYRYRVGNLRVVYHLGRKRKVVTVLAILPRGEAYKK
ncbi:MAG: type II toxin-antitoxin system RelE/ParE family toxin [Firmicutes bacterium]|nr:type II toxin-antitoxin system RelE/ParE family toxin [Bacillota bacterium]